MLFSRLTILSSCTANAHPFHLHGHTFQITRRTFPVFMSGKDAET